MLDASCRVWAVASCRPSLGAATPSPPPNLAPQKEVGGQKLVLPFKKLYKELSKSSTLVAKHSLKDH